MPQNATVLRWSAYEHEHIERGSDWYWALGIIALSVAAISILLSNVLFGLLIIAAAFAIALISRTPPELVQFELSEKGMRVNGLLHGFDEMIAFWVEDEHRERPLLLIDTVKFLSPNIVVPIEHVDPGVVRAFLKERMEEKRMKEPLSHRILEFFGF